MQNLKSIMEKNNLVNPVKDITYYSELIFKISLIVFVASLSSFVFLQTIAIIIAFISILIFLLTKRPIKGIEGDIGIAVLSFIFIKIISVLFSVSILDSVQSLGKFFCEVVFFFLAIFGIKSRKDLKILLLIAITVGIIESCFGTFHFIIAKPAREGGTLEPNALGAILASFIPIAICLVIEVGSRGGKILLIIGTILITLCVLFTQCRGAWFGLFIAIIFLSLFRNKKFILFLLLILLTILIHPVLRERLYQTFNIYGGGVRIEQISRASELFVKRPILGWGPNTFKGLFFFDGEEHSHCHNIYLELLYSSGFFSLFIFVLIVLATFKFAFNQYWRRKDIILLGLISSIIVILSHGFFDSTLYGVTGFMFWFLVGCIFSYKKYIEESQIITDR